jgi:hypothetical protein
MGICIPHQDPGQPFDPGSPVTTIKLKDRETLHGFLFRKESMLQMEESYSMVTI